MEIDLTQSDDEEETLEGKKASCRPQQAAVQDLFSSNSNLESIDRGPTSLPPPLELIDTKISIQSK